VSGFPVYNQSLVLARGGDLIVFAAALGRRTLPVPDLGSFGVTVSDDGAVCQRGGYSYCIGRSHRARVTMGGDSATLAGGETSTIGWLTFTVGFFNEEIDESSFCDDKSSTRMAAFRSR